MLCVGEWGIEGSLNTYINDHIKPVPKRLKYKVIQIQNKQNQKDNKQIYKSVNQ